MGTLLALAAVPFIIGACSGGPSNGAVGVPPFPDLEQLVVSSDLSIIGRVTSVSELQTVPRRDDPTSRVAYYEASVEVDRILFGLHYNRVVVHVPVYYVAGNDSRIPTKAPPLELGEAVMLFLTQNDSLFDLNGNDFVTTGGGVVWGKLAVKDEDVTALHPAEESLPSAEVTAWIEAARFSLAKPGLLAGEVSGLDEGDRATISLLELGRSHREETGVMVTEWTLGNGPWERDGLRLSQGTYILVPEAEGYLPLHLTQGLMFEVPAERMDWRERDLGFAFFRPKDAADKPLSTGTGWLPERSVRGRIAGIPNGVDATVRIQRLPHLPNEIYAIGPPLSEGTSSYYPPELTCLEEIDNLEPEETVAVVEVHNGRWGLSDHALAGNRHLLTIEALGFSAKPAGYVAVVFGGKAPHRLRGVDFYVGDSEAPDCDAESGVPEEPSTSTRTPNVTSYPFGNSHTDS